MLNGKSPQEQMQFAQNMMKERGLTQQDVMNMAKQYGINL